MWILAASIGHADDLDITYQGLVSVAAEATDQFTLQPIEAEFDVAGETGILSFRADLDVRVDALGVTTEDGEFGFTPPLGPEWAMVQIGRREYVRFGVTNPQIGFEDWDPWVNYLPTYGILFNGASPGRNLGVEVGIVSEGGVDTFLWAGQDLEWGYPMAGAGVSYAGDAFGTWSGVVAYPTAENAIDGSKGTYATFDSFEFYPATALTVTLDGGAGVVTGKPFAGGQLFLNALPEEIFGVVGRIQGAWAEDDAFDQYGTTTPSLTAGLGVRAEPGDYVRFDVEGKMQRFDGDWQPMLHARLTLRAPAVD
jgi:hypothetical protein